MSFVNEYSEASVLKTPKLSVVMSAYNAESFIREAVKSVLAQKFKDFEFLIVDDASTDYSCGYVEELARQDDRIISLKNSRRCGLTKSLNQAIGRARAPWIARQDADDLSHPLRFSLEMEQCHRSPQAGLVGTWYEGIDEGGGRLYKMILPTEDLEIKKWLRSVNCFCHGSVIFSKEVFDRLGGYPEQYPFAQDYALWLRFSSRVRMVNLPEVLYAKRNHPRTVSENYPERWLVLRQIKSDTGLLDPSVPLKNFIAMEHWEHSRFLRAMGYNKMGLMSWFKGFWYRYQPAFLWKQVENKIRRGRWNSNPAS